MGTDHRRQPAVFADDGEGFINLGADGVYEFDDDGDLLVQFDYYWVALDGRIVCFYQEAEDYDEEEAYWYSCGDVPIWFEEEEAELVVVWDSENPDGYVAGWRYTTFGGETQKGLFGWRTACILASSATTTPTTANTTTGISSEL